MNRHHDYVICKILAWHDAGRDIESIAAQLRMEETEEKWDVHRVGSLIGYYVSSKQQQERNHG